MRSRAVMLTFPRLRGCWSSLQTFRCHFLVDFLEQVPPLDTHKAYKIAPARGSTTPSRETFQRPPRWAGTFYFIRTPVDGETFQRPAINESSSYIVVFATHGRLLAKQISHLCKPCLTQPLCFPSRFSLSSRPKRSFLCFDFLCFGDKKKKRNRKHEVTQRARKKKICNYTSEGPPARAPVGL